MGKSKSTFFLEHAVPAYLWKKYLLSVRQGEALHVTVHVSSQLSGFATSDF